MKIGILGAMIEEVSSLKEIMKINKTFSIGDRIYYEGIINQVSVVLTFSRWGKVASASTVTTLVNKFEVDFVLFTGVAGAVCSDLNIGDIVIATGLYQHDMDARPFFDQFQIPLTPITVFEPIQEDIDLAYKASENFIRNIHTIINNRILTKYSISNPRVIKGLIASGDKFISNIAQYEELNFSHNEKNVLAVEMEGAAVAQVCSEYKIPFIVLRTISDKSDQASIFDFPSFIKDIARFYSLQIIKKYIELVGEIQ